MGPLDHVTLEVAYAVIIAGICLAIFLKTRNAYSLTKHPGIFHFRNIFLYFAFSYAFRLFAILVVLSFMPLGMGFHRSFHDINVFLIGYFSTMAILSLAVTVFIRRIGAEDGRISTYMHISAIILSLAIFMLRSTDMLFMIQTSIFLATVAAVFLGSSGKARMTNQNKLTYLLLFIFWILNLLASSSRTALEFNFIVYPLSALIFLWIYIRVNRGLGKHAKKEK